MSLGSLGIGAAGLAGAFDGKAPASRSYFDEMNEAIDMQKVIAPEWIGYEREFRPQWNDLFMDSLRGVLPKLTDVYEGTISPFLRRQESADRENVVGDAERLAPKMSAAQRASNPGGAGLLDELLALSRDELDDGMSAGEMRDVQQAVRGAQAARGVGYGPRDVAEEVYGVGLESRALRKQSQEQALRALLASQAFYANPLAAIMGMRSGTAAVGSAVPGIALSRTGNVFNPESEYLAGIKGQDYSGKLATMLDNQATRRQSMQMTADGINSVTKMAAGFV